MSTQNGHFNIVVWLVEEGKASVDQALKNGETSLFIAVYLGHNEMVRWLIDEGNANVDHARQDGYTPLFAVMRCGRQANSDATPLPTAGHECDADTHRWLVDEGNANVNKVSANGATPLLIALDGEVINIDMVHFLLSVGAHVRSLDDSVFNSYARASIQRRSRSWR